MKISVIIPTYNRAEVLKKCLERLAEQTLEKEKFEVIVVDDGSSDGTKKVVEDAIGDVGFELSYLRQENQGQGVARNKGIGVAKGDVVLFIGDDILVDKHFLEMHLDQHKKNPEANIGVLGFIDWDPSIKITPFMEWLTNGSSILGKFGGHQFAFEKLKDKKWADYNFFYTSNISLKKSLLEEEKFDEDFHGYGWEDIELGYRLAKKKDFKLSYEPRAIGYHLHEMDERSLRGRMMGIGKSAHVINSKWPELKKVPGWRKQLVFFLLGNWVTVGALWVMSRIFKKLLPLYFYALSKRYFLKGVWYNDF